MEICRYFSCWNPQCSYFSCCWNTQCKPLLSSIAVGIHKVLTSISVAGIHNNYTCTVSELFTCRLLYIALFSVYIGMHNVAISVAGIDKVAISGTGIHNVAKCSLSWNTQYLAISVDTVHTTYIFQLLEYTI